MAIAYVRDTGHQTGNGVDSANASFASLPASGNSVVVLVSCWDGTLTAVAEGNVTDNQSNTYTRDISSGPPSGLAHSATIHMDIDIGSPSGTFTLTLNPPDSGGNSYFEWIGVEFSGLADSSALDKTAAAEGAPANTSPTVTTAATTQADELILGVLSIANSSTSNLGIDLPAGYTQLGSIIQDGYSTVGFMGAYKIVSATGAQTFDGGTLTSTTSGGWEIVVATYKATGAAADNVYNPQPGIIMQAVNRGAVI